MFSLKRTAISLISILVATSANAVPITVTQNIAFGGGTCSETCGFDPSAAPLDIQLGILTFIYDSSTKGSGPKDGFAFFENPLISASVFFQRIGQPDFLFVFDGVSSFMTNGEFGTNPSLTFSTDEAGGNFQSGVFRFLWTARPTFDGEIPERGRLPNLDDWNGVDGRTSRVDGSLGMRFTGNEGYFTSQTDFGPGAGLLDLPRQFVASSPQPIPAPNSAALLLIGILIIRFAARRSTAIVSSSLLPPQDVYKRKCPATACK